jgi:hypothetical protein
MKTLTLDASGHIHPSWYMLQAISQRLHPEQDEKSRAIQIGSTIYSPTLLIIWLSVE